MVSVRDPLSDTPRHLAPVVQGGGASVSAPHRACGPARRISPARDRTASFERWFAVVLLHKFRDDLVLALELVAQRRDDAEVLALGQGVLAFEGGAILEEQFLPGREQGGLVMVLVAQGRRRASCRSDDA